MLGDKISLPRFSPIYCLQTVLPADQQVNADSHRTCTCYIVYLSVALSPSITGVVLNGLKKNKAVYTATKVIHKITKAIGQEQ